MAGFSTINLFLLLSFLCAIPASAFQVDLEVLAQHRDRGSGQDDTGVEKAGLGIKKIFSDDSGDRVQLFLRGEASDNFKEKNIEQLYAKYKGPMGKWNITLGRMPVPFGLITEYDTEWQIVNTQELKTIGFKNDDGFKVSGFAGQFDYDFLISRGEGTESGVEDSNGMGVLKIAYKGLDSESFNTGFSLLYNRTSDSERKLAGIDIIKYYGPLISRNEFVIGEESDTSILSLFSGIDYKLWPAVDLNLAYNYFREDIKEEIITMGVTYNSPFYGLIFRLGNKYHIIKNGGNENEVFIQAYKHFSAFF